MELFTLGEGNGYTETDIREAARALTGYVKGKRAGGVLLTTRFEPENHDGGIKRIFGKHGRFGPHDVAAARASPITATRSSWCASCGPTSSTSRSTSARGCACRGSTRAPGTASSRSSREILDHPKLYADLDGPTMVKSPVVAIAGMLRATRMGVDRDDWAWVLAGMGQRLFGPPSVAGWEWGPAWMSSNGMRMRFVAANVALSQPGLKVQDGDTPVDLKPPQQLDRALASSWPSVGAVSARAKACSRWPRATTPWPARSGSARSPPT